MQDLFFQKWIPEGPVQAGIVLVHGAGEHSGRYEHVKDWFLARQIAFFAGDLPGFGRSPGRRGHINRFSDYVNTVKDWVETAKSAIGDAPLFVLGNSVGGLVTIRLLQESAAGNLPIRGVILCSPCLRLKLHVPLWKQRLAAALSKLTPGLRLPNGIDAAAVSRSRSVVEAYSTDPYNEHRVSFRWFEELHTAMQHASLQAGRIRYPILLLQAGADRIVDPDAAAPFIEKVSARDRKIKVYPGFYHELLNEPEREEVLADILEWIETSCCPQSYTGE